MSLTEAKTKITNVFKTNGTGDITGATAAGALTGALDSVYADKVDVESGKGLSSNDFTTVLKTQITTNATSISSLVSKVGDLSVVDGALNITFEE